MAGPQVREGERGAGAKALVPTGHPAHDLTVDPDGLGAQGHGERIGEDEGAQAPVDALGLHSAERLAPHEVGLLVEGHCEPEPGLEGVVLRREVEAPHPVALLDPHRVDGPVAASDQAEGLATGPQRVPEGGAVLGRAVQLPSELADEGDPQREHGHRADRQVLCGEVGEGLVSDRRVGQAGEELA